jgi:multidrug efflux pump subunit AcrB
MAFLGVVSLVGVIVSHVIVLFDFIEEALGERRKFGGCPAGRRDPAARPVLITVGATVFALVPLALTWRTAVGTALLCPDRLTSPSRR